MLEVLDGSCKTPIAGLARIGPEDELDLRGLVAWPDGSTLHSGSRSGNARDAEALGRDLGEELRARAGDALFAALAD